MRKSVKKRLWKLQSAHENKLSILRAPVNPETKPTGKRQQKVEIINGMVTYSGRYSRLHEDYDDK